MLAVPYAQRPQLIRCLSQQLLHHLAIDTDHILTTLPDNPAHHSLRPSPITVHLHGSARPKLDFALLHTMILSWPDVPKMQVLCGLPSAVLLIQVLHDVAEPVDSLGHRRREPGRAVGLPLPQHLDLLPGLVNPSTALRLEGDHGQRRDPLTADVVAAAADEVRGERHDLAGDGERNGDGGAGVCEVGDGGDDDAGPPAVAIEGLDDVVELESRRRRGRRRSWSRGRRRRPRADVGGSDGLRAVFGDEVRVGDGVQRRVAGAAGGLEIDDGGLEPGAVVALVVDAGLDLGAGRQRGQLLGRGGARRASASLSGGSGAGQRPPASGRRPWGLGFSAAGLWKVWLGFSAALTNVCAQW